MRGTALGVCFLALAVTGWSGCEDDEDEPRLEIIDPAAGEMVKIEVSDMTVSVRISVRDFDIKRPGACVGEDDPCGQVALKIDGDLCNRPGTTYNTLLMEEDTTIDADFSQCPADRQIGSHTITVTLLPENAATVGVPTSTVEASVSVVTTH